MSPEDNHLHNNEDQNEAPDQPEAVERPITDYEAGRRSITTHGATSRRDLVEKGRRQQARSRPFVLVATLALIGLLTIPVYAYFQIYVFPPRELALRVEDTEYSRGDVLLKMLFLSVHLKEMIAFYFL